jgi:hypothetical protein
MLSLVSVIGLNIKIPDQQASSLLGHPPLVCHQQKMSAAPMSTQHELRTVGQNGGSGRLAKIQCFAFVQSNFPITGSRGH